MPVDLADGATLVYKMESIYFRWGLRLNRRWNRNQYNYGACSTRQEEFIPLKNGKTDIGGRYCQAYASIKFRLGLCRNLQDDDSLK